MAWRIVEGVLLPFWGTALGAACVFFLKGGLGRGLKRALNGLSAGIMAAASFFSLLLPALERSAALGPWAFAPAAAGLSLGLGFLPALDALLRRLEARGEARRGLGGLDQMILAITLHNLPEGMAVGAAYAAAARGPWNAGLAAAGILALGIAAQNVPEGAIVALPLRAAGKSRGRAFFWGVVSGAVEPLGAAAVLLSAELFTLVLPVLLAFAAGAMLYVILRELAPEMSGGAAGGILWFALGFTVMMALDVGLG